ncbi:BACON domain-containing protein [Streptomyces sp. NPDC001443]
MMSSSPDTSPRTTGAHRARGHAAAHTQPQRPPACYEPYLDGLFTYCLSVLCDHDTATAALGDVLALVERRGQRVPEAAGNLRAWLYALARWACLRKLTEARQRRQSTHAAGRPDPRRRTPQPAGHPVHQPPQPPQSQQPPHPAGLSVGQPVAPSAASPVSEEVQELRRRELARLAWPEAAGTSPEQREALELAVRHHLAAHEVAAVVGLDPAAARELLASAACEVERTRAALAVVETGGCPGVAHLTGDHQLVLSATLRRELVRHVDDCPRCRRAAERAVPGRWPGAMFTPAELPVLEAPRAALHAAMAHAPRARGAAPRFDRRGFPMDPKDHAARRDRLRARAVTTTVVATVVAAPVLALWAAYRGAETGEGADGRSASTTEAQGPGSLDGSGAGGYENAGNASTRAGARATGSSDVSVAVVSVVGAGRRSAGHLDVTASSSGDTTLITLTATGDSPVRWSATTQAAWLYLSRSSGTLAPGASLTIKVHVDQLREPSGHWSARVAIAPAGTVVSIDGYGTAPAPSAPGGTGGPQSPPPTGTASASTGPTPSVPPSADPDPTPTDSASADPGSPSPPPDGDDDDDPSPADS